MKNTINYYYNLTLKNIHQKNDAYYLNINNQQYIFMPYYGEINKLNNIYNFLINYNIYCHEIIYNRENHIITIFNEKPYILLKIYYNNLNLINMNDIISYKILIETDKICNWRLLWCQKLDYYEYQLREFGKKYPLIRDSFSYYNGLCETAISLLNNVNLDKVNLYLNHQRIYKNMNLVDFFNPLNLIIDVKVRDICEYFKIKFFENEYIIDEVKNYLYLSKLNNSEIMLFFIRLIYPSYYFDLYDNIIQEKIKEEKINIYINKINNYEIFLKNIYNIINNNYYKLPEIEWIIKM